MKASNYRLDVARFVLRPVGDLLRLEFDATLAATVPLPSVELVLPGREPHALTNGAEPASELALAARLEADDDPALDEACLAVETANGDRLSFDLGALLRRPNWWPRILSFGEGEGTLHPPDALALADAIVTRFGGLDQADLVLHPQAGRWHATSLRYGLAFRTDLSSELDRAEAANRAWPAVRAAADEILATVEKDSAPLLVLERTTGDTDETVRTLHDTLRARNAAAALLLLDRARTPGPVARYRNQEDDRTVPFLFTASPDADRQATLTEVRDLLLAGP